MSLEITLTLCGFSFVAGFIDAVVGGGGLIQLPALLVFCPGWPHTTALGTNKFASLAGTSVALLRYLRSIKLERRIALPSAMTAVVGSVIGAWCVSLLSPDFFRPLVIVLLIGVAIYSWKKKKLGGDHKPKLRGTQELITALVVALSLGFYDGFFGPGTGTFLLFLYIGVFGYNFIIGSAYAKVVNLSTNAGALCFFIATGSVNYSVAIPMALAQIVGGYTGAHVAIKKGAPFVRILFLIVVSALILRLLMLELGY